MASNWRSQRSLQDELAAQGVTGIAIAGTRALRVRGRKTGKSRGVVVNVLTVDDVDYLVSPRGTTQWVRNVRAARVAGASARQPADGRRGPGA